MTFSAMLVFMCKLGNKVPPKYTFHLIRFSLMLAGNLANCQQAANPVAFHPTQHYLLLIVGYCTFCMLESHAWTYLCGQWNSDKSISNFELWSTSILRSIYSKDLMNFFYMNESVMRILIDYGGLWELFIHEHLKKNVCFFLLSLIFRGNINVSFNQ